MTLENFYYFYMGVVVGVMAFAFVSNLIKERRWKKWQKVN